MRGTSTLRPSGLSLLRSGLTVPLTILAVVALIASCAGPAPTPPLPTLTPVPSTRPSAKSPALTRTSFTAAGHWRSTSNRW